ncbi:beta strand repeat-containing protein [Persephonella sp.]
MRHKKRNLLAAAMLAVAVSAPSMAQPQAISDDALEEVSGQGLQVVENHNAVFDHGGVTRGNLNSQNNNLDSVQLNDSSLSSSTVGYGGVLANSAVNTTANYLYDSIGNVPPPPPPPGGQKVYSHTFTQMNNGEAVNHENTANTPDQPGVTSIAVNLNKQSQSVNTDPDPDKTSLVSVLDQNNNNNSVQLNETAQKDASGVLHTNAAASAVNSGENFFVSGGLDTTTGLQQNNQEARNFNNYAYAQMDNEEAIAGAGNVELNPTQRVSNGGTMLSHGNDISENVYIGKNSNNNNSVQLNDEAQMNANFITLKNVANTATNNGINIVQVSGDVAESSIGQNNSQEAKNHYNEAEGYVAVALNLNKQTQHIDNGHYTGDRTPDSPKATIDYQNNNNNSVQLNNSAQSSASVLIMENAAASAVNTGVNLVHVSGNTTASSVDQSNMQSASNFDNKANGKTLAAAGNAEVGITQDINNYWTEIKTQNNNNNSVQLNDDAQTSITGVVVENIANSAANTGVNLMAGDETLGDVNQKSGDFSTTLIQNNNQTATNHVNTASADTEEGIAIAANINKQTQIIRNFTTDTPPDLVYISDQDNNNNSVQLNGNAQSGATAVVLSNTSLSAVNTGLNVMNVSNLSGTHVGQANNQTAANFTNDASGAVAIAGNAELNDSTFYKTGEMEAGQVIENIHAVIPAENEQNNNNNSVQLNDNAQVEASGLTIANVANSALNIGFNLMNTDDISDDSSIMQTNTQEAQNHVNYAEGADVAFAGNINKQKQYIYNCNCSSIEGEQNNNMNSVQLNDNAQAGINSTILLNVAGSAVNAGVNMVHAGVISGSSVTQVNSATAVNFSNTANGANALAGNGEIGNVITLPTFP